MTKEDRELLTALEKKLDKFYAQFMDEKKLNAEHRQQYQEEMGPLRDLLGGAVVFRKVLLWVTSVTIALASTWIAIKGIIK